MTELRHPEVKEVVASILARRVAMEVSDTDSDAESEDSDWTSI